MTRTRQLRQQARNAGTTANLTLLKGQDPEQVFITKLEDAWDLARSIWGRKEAQQLFTTAFASADPLRHIRDRLPHPPTRPAA